MVRSRSLTHCFEDFTLESDQHRLLKGNTELALRPKAFETLAYLVTNQNRLITKQELLDSIWPAVYVNEHAVAQCIREIRRVLGDDPSRPRFIKTVPRLGYKFIADVTERNSEFAEKLRVPASSPSIAVLPFKDMSAEHNQEYFCEGIAEEIINALTKLDGVRVVARTSAFSFKDESKDIREISQRLNAEVLLEGSVRTDGTRFRISVQLLDAASGYHLWSEQYDRKMEDILTVQGDIAVKVVDKMNLEIAGSQRTAMLKHHTNNMAAYHLYLKGRYFWSKEGGEVLDRAAGYFQQAIAEDPHYAMAYAGLSLCYFIMWVWDYRPEARIMLKGKQAALRAVEIDETLGPAHMSLGLSRLVYDWDWRGAHRSFLRAVELSPGDLYSHTSFAVYFMALGEMDQAIAECSVALEIDPLSPQAHTYLGMYFARAGSPDKAIPQFQQALEIQPDQPQAHWLLGQALILDSCHQEGVHEIEKALELSGQTPAVLAGLGWAYGMTGRKCDARQILETLQNRSRDEYIRPYLVAKVHCAIGDVDEAFEWLTKALDERDRKLAFVKTDETLTAIRGDARFSKLLRKMGLPVTT